MRSTFLALVVFTTFALACGKPKAGDACPDNGARVCVDGKTSLYCAKGSWQVDTCKGAKGCVEAGKIVTCDTTGNAVGDPCPAGLEGIQSCAADGKNRLICVGGKYTSEPCKGKEGCTLVQSVGVTCDLGPPEVGGVCKVDKLQACTPDGKSLMVCEKGAYVVKQRCPGSNGCKSQGGGLVSCDPKGDFVDGDLCYLLSAACSKDGHTSLECKDGKFTVGQQCPGEGGCGMGDCDTGLAKLGDFCKPGRHACSDDKKALLACKDKDGVANWAVDKKCPKECEPKDGKLECK